MQTLCVKVVLHWWQQNFNHYSMFCWCRLSLIVRCEALLNGSTDGYKHAVAVCRICDKNISYNCILWNCSLSKLPHTHIQTHTSSLIHLLAHSYTTRIECITPENVEKRTQINSWKFHFCCMFNVHVQICAPRIVTPSLGHTVKCISEITTDPNKCSILFHIQNYLSFYVFGLFVCCVFV